MIWNQKLWATKVKITRPDGEVEEHVWPSLFYFTRERARQHCRKMRSVAAPHVKYSVIRVHIYEERR